MSKDEKHVIHTNHRTYGQGYMKGEDFVYDPAKATKFKSYAHAASEIKKRRTPEKFNATPVPLSGAKIIPEKDR